MIRQHITALPLEAKSLFAKILKVKFWLQSHEPNIFIDLQMSLLTIYSTLTYPLSIQKQENF